MTRPKPDCLWNWPLICMVDRGNCIAMNEANQMMPITNWFDEDGNDLPVEERENAVVCVAGIEGWAWYTIDLRKFQKELVN